MKRAFRFTIVSIFLPKPGQTKKHQLRTGDFVAIERSSMKISSFLSVGRLRIGPNMKALSALTKISQN